jgi:hypothetical protein
MALSTDSTDALLDGIRLSDLADELPVGRSSLFELLKSLRITTQKGPGADGKGRVAWVNISQAEHLDRVSVNQESGHKETVAGTTSVVYCHTRPSPCNTSPT